MGIKLGIALGLGAGYYLGAKAGRKRYEQIRKSMSVIRGMSLVSKPMDAATSRVSTIVRKQGEKVTDKVADTVKEHLFGRPVGKNRMDSEQKLDENVDFRQENS